MDIAGPSFEEYVSPAPWWASGGELGVRRAVQQCIQRRPGASVDELVAELTQRGVEVNGALVAQQLLELAPPAPAEQTAQAESREAELVAASG